MKRRTGTSPSRGGLTVSLIIPAYNEQSVLRSKLENAVSITCPQETLQIIVASDGSSDETVVIAREFEDRGVKVLAFTERRGKASAVNDAVAAATGEIICLCDANVMFRPDALQWLVAALDDSRVGAATGDVRLASPESNFGEGESLYYRIERAIQLGESRIGSVMSVDGGMYVIRKELFRPLPPDTILDDFVTTMNVIRQGKRVVYVPDAIATENGTPTAWAEFRRRMRVSAGAVQALKRGNRPRLFQTPIEFFQFISHKLLRWLGPVWLVLILVSSILLWNGGLIYRLAVGAQGLLYFSAIVATFSLRFRETRIGGITFYFVMSHVAMTVGLVKGLFNRQRVTWNRTERTAVSNEVKRAAAN